MQLRDFMYKNRLTCAKMAADLQINSVYLSAIKNGKRKPGFELAMKIELLTGGQVTCKELRG